MRNAVPIGGTGTSKSHLAIAIARDYIRGGERTAFTPSSWCEGTPFQKAPSAPVSVIEHYATLSATADEGQRCRGTRFFDGLTTFTSTAGCTSPGILVAVLAGAGVGIVPGKEVCGYSCESTGGSGEFF